jgi:hypothetical protein
VRRLIWAAVAAAAVVAVAGTAGAALKQKSVEFTVAADQETEETAKCKRGQGAVAGGFFVETDGSGGLLPTFESQRDGKRGWNYRLYSSDATEATVYAYCDKHEPELKVKAATEALPDDSVGTVTARCGRGKQAVSGGFDAPLTELAAVASKRSGKRSWEATFVGPPGEEVTAVAYCDKREPGLKTKQAATDVPSAGIDSVSAKCKRKQELRSGGFEIEFDPGVMMDEDQGLAFGSRRAGKRRWEVSGFAFDGAPDMVAYAYCDKTEKK